MSSVQAAVCAGSSKAECASSDTYRYLFRAVMAGVYLSLIVMVYWALIDGLHTSPFGKVLGSLYFGVGLTVIVFTRTELFTSNCFYMTVSTWAGETTFRDTLRVLGVSWVGNLLGAMGFGSILHAAGVLQALPERHALFVGALHKTQGAAGALFWKGALANFVVCLAIWVALQLREELARLISIVLTVFVFLYLGFEHSIANMGTFCFSFLGGGEAALTAILRNLGLTTVGNFMGGMALVGLPAAYLEKVPLKRGRSNCSTSELAGEECVD